MRRGLLRSLSIAALCAATSACYQAHERPESAPDASQPDALVVDANDDANVDAWFCNGRTVGYLEPCNPEIELECQQRATMQAYGRFAYSHCYTLPDGRNSECSSGDWCGDGPPCRCTATRFCAGEDEVCVSDTPDGVHYCAPVCTRP